MFISLLLKVLIAILRIIYFFQLFPYIFVIPSLIFTPFCNKIQLDFFFKFLKICFLLIKFKILIFSFLHLRFLQTIHVNVNISAMILNN